MHRRTLAGLAIAALGIAACVDVPDNMRAQFAGPGPNDRTNYRPGPHGIAPPPDPALPTTTLDAGIADAGLPDVGPPVIPDTDGGSV